MVFCFAFLFYIDINVTHSYSLSVCVYLGERLETDVDPGGTTAAQHLCDVLLTAVYPTLVAMDARCYGSAVGISKKQLWTLFSLDALVSI